ncbi:probable kinetochore protein NUF2 [Nasonia vitripennis]|uniref:Uncharacterized protein n=1 Tax=Nasonia vitripennis TaxID=7425 RepID=A0A7M7T8R2_NASVI|nr:probable kinetochore protein NUF2 [Nasonia vitripennis]
MDNEVKTPTTCASECTEDMKISQKLRMQSHNKINFDDCQTDSITTNLQSELAALTYQRDKLTTEIQEIKSKLRLRDSEITQLQEEIDYLREQAVRQNAVLCSFKKQIQEKECLEMQYKVSEREVTEFRDKIVNYKRKIDNLSSTINLQDVLICQLKDELRNRDEKIQELLNELNQLQESLASLISCPNRYVESNENAIKERIHEILKENQDNILV